MNDDKETIITLIHMRAEYLQRHKLGAVTLQLMGPKAEVAAYNGARKLVASSGSGSSSEPDTRPVG